MCSRQNSLLGECVCTFQVMNKKKRLSQLTRSCSESSRFSETNWSKTKTPPNFYVAITSKNKDVFWRKSLVGVVMREFGEHPPAGPQWLLVVMETKAQCESHLCKNLRCGKMSQLEKFKYSHCVSLKGSRRAFARPWLEMLIRKESSVRRDFRVAP